ncbi:MAG: protein-glutamate O-methyltransferase CheR [Vulcanimicrobiota bacterium]
MDTCSKLSYYQQLENLRDTVFNLCGFSIDLSNKEKTGERVKAYLAKKRYGSVKELLDVIKIDSSLEVVSELVYALIGKTPAFTLNSGHFDYLRHHILPGFRFTKLRIWMTGCTSGEEAYSLAILLQEELQYTKPVDISILATDLSQTILMSIREGKYDEASLKNLPHCMIEKYFIQEMHNNKPLYYTKEPLLKMVRVASLNPISTWPMRGPFDIIFCRNLFEIIPTKRFKTMVYHDSSAQNKLLNRFKEILSPDGYLFVTHHDCAADHPQQFVISKRSSTPVVSGYSSRE